MFFSCSLNSNRSIFFFVYRQPFHFPVQLSPLSQVLLSYASEPLLLLSIALLVQVAPPSLLSFVLLGVSLLRTNDSSLFFCFFFSPNFLISWRLINLQYCSGFFFFFCHTLTWISHRFTCVPHPASPSHPPPCPIPLGHPSAPAPSLTDLATETLFFCENWH